MWEYVDLPETAGVRNEKLLLCVYVRRFGEQCVTLIRNFNKNIIVIKLQEKHKNGLSIIIVKLSK